MRLVGFKAALGDARAGQLDAVRVGFLADRLLPALLFGAAAAAQAASVPAALGRMAADSSFPAILANGLDVGQRGLALLFCGLVAGLFLIRRTPRTARARPFALAVALSGTFLMSGLAGHPPAVRDWRVLALADGLLVVGLGFSAYAAASLGRCFGLAAEARGLVTSGPYRLVRHPLYLGELVVALGVVLPILTPLAAVIFGIFCLVQAVRAMLEERVLSAAFPEYAAYRRRTPALSPWPRPRRAPRSGALRGRRKRCIARRRWRRSGWR